MTAVQQRLWALAGIAGTAAVLALGWFLFVGPQLDAATSASDDYDSMTAQNAALQTRIDFLKTQEAKLPELQKELDAKRTELPVRPEVETFAATLQTIGERDLVSISTYTVGEPIAVTAKDAAAGTTAAATTSAAPATPAPSSATSTPGTTVPAPAAGASAAARTTYALPVTFTVQGAAASVDTFVKDLQADGQRALLVTKADVQPVAGLAGGTIAGDVVATYSGTIWVSPLDPAAAAKLFGANG
jgi:hypothetical protein